MHEMGIASSILEAAAKEARSYPGHYPAKIGVTIGEYAGVDTESLRFCFEVLSKDLAAPVELDIQWRVGTDDLKLAYLEMEEVFDGTANNRKESPERERSDRGAAA